MDVVQKEPGATQRTREFETTIGNESLLATVPGIIYVLDEKGKFIYVSDSVEKDLGYLKTDLLGQHFSTIIFPEDLPTVSRDHILPRFSGICTGSEKAPKLFDERRSYPRKTEGLQVRLRGNPKKSPDTESVLFCKVNASGQYRKSAGGNQFCGTVGVIFDVTPDDPVFFNLEAKRRYNALDLLAQALSHAFSNVFTGIYGNLQLIEMQIEEKNCFSKNLEAIKHSIENAVSLISQLTRAISVPREKNHKATLQNLVQRTVSEVFLHPVIKSEFSFEPDLLEAETDPDYLSHIMRSILFYIRQTVRAPGPVRISVSNQQEREGELPRLDCLYISIRIEFPCGQEHQNPGSSILEGCNEALEKIATMALSYTLLKKIGGMVTISTSDSLSTVVVCIPALNRR